MASRAASFELRYKGQTYEQAAAGLRRLARSMTVRVDTLAPALRRELDRYLEEVTSELARRHSGPWPGGTGPDSLSVRSGHLLGALNDGARSAGTRLRDITGRIVIPEPYVIHEFGGRIAAEKASYLTIPLPAALDARGVPLKRSARDWQNTFVRESRRGNLLIFRRRGKEIVPLYALKREVRVPPRLGVRDRLQEHLPEFVERASAALVAALASARS
jgi:hypothetical protein